MKNYLLCLLSLLLVTISNAQTIHWLTFIDTTDKNVDANGIDHGVGCMDLIGRKVLYSKFINVVNSALAEKGYKSDIQDYWDTSTSPENCKKAVQNLFCKPEDIVVFYYIGHGGRPENDDVKAHPYPQMFLAQNSDRKLIPLEWVHNTLKSKGARLTITIGMCCNKKDANMSIKRAPSFQTTVNFGSAYVPNVSINAIQQLFLENKGDIIATSASPDEYSWGAVGFSDFGGIDDYTACFVDKFHEKAESGDLDWKSFFTEVGLYVREINKEMRRSKTQTPIFSANVSSIAKPRQQERSKPSERVETEQKDKKQETNNKNGNVLTEHLDYIVDKNIPLGERLEIAQRLKSIFSKDATIKILAQDVDQVLDKESVDVFFNRISSSRILLKVIPVDYKISENKKVVEFKVREYYKK